MTHDEATIRLSEIEMMLNTVCQCEICFNHRVYLERRKNDLTALINDKLTAQYKDGIRIDRTKN